MRSGETAALIQGKAAALPWQLREFTIGQPVSLQGAGNGRLVGGNLGIAALIGILLRNLEDAANSRT